MPMGVWLCKSPSPRIKVSGTKIISPSFEIPILPCESKGVGVVLSTYLVKLAMIIIIVTINQEVITKGKNLRNIFLASLPYFLLLKTLTRMLFVAFNDINTNRVAIECINISKNPICTP